MAIWTMQPSWRRALVAAGAFLLGGGAANGWVLLAGHAPPMNEAAREGETALVLAGGLRGGRPSPLLEDRLEVALELVRSGRVAKLLLSGNKASPTGDEPAAMRRWLTERGVADASLIVDGESHDTFTSVFRARHAYRLNRLIIVTQPFHLPRAIFIAKSLGLEALASPVPPGRFRGDLRHPVRELVSRSAAVVDRLRGRGAAS